MEILFGWHLKTKNPFISERVFILNLIKDYLLITRRVFTSFP